jgi:hypothetical protein
MIRDVDLPFRTIIADSVAVAASRVFLSIS